MPPDELIPYLAGAALSLGLSYLPKVKEKFEALNSTQKRLVVLVLLVGATAGLYTASCMNLRTDFICTTQGAYEAALVLAKAAVASQTAFLLTPSK